jgi:hypothetical protein
MGSSDTSSKDARYPLVDQRCPTYFRVPPQTVAWYETRFSDGVKDVSSDRFSEKSLELWQNARLWASMKLPSSKRRGDHEVKCYRVPFRFSFSEPGATESSICHYDEFGHTGFSSESSILQGEGGPKGRQPPPPPILHFPLLGEGQFAARCFLALLNTTLPWSTK